MKLTLTHTTQILHLQRIIFITIETHLHLEIISKMLNRTLTSSSTSVKYIANTGMKENFHPHTLKHFTKKRITIPQPATFSNYIPTLLFPFFKLHYITMLEAVLKEDLSSPETKITKTRVKIPSPVHPE